MCVDVFVCVEIGVMGTWQSVSVCVCVCVCVEAGSWAVARVGGRRQGEGTTLGAQSCFVEC